MRLLNRRELKNQIQHQVATLLAGEDNEYVAMAVSYYDGGMPHIAIDFEDLENVDVELSLNLLQHPDLVLRTLKGLLREERRPDQEEIDLVLRFYNLPRDAEKRVSQLRVEDLGNLVKVRGRIKKAQKVKSRIVLAAWKCKRCGAVIRTEIEGTELKPPIECTKKQNGCGKGGSSTSFNLAEDECVFDDSQVIYIEEPFDAETKGQPQSIQCVLTGDIVGVFTTNEIIMNGVARNYRLKKDTAINDFYLDVNSYETTMEEEDLTLTQEEKNHYEDLVRGLENPLQSYVRSFAPHIAGCTEEKTALVLQEFGGVTKTISDGTVRFRGDSHILLVGDYSTGKSQLLKVSAAIAPKGLFTSAENASIVGLTCAVVKDPLDGAWNAEMGVMPLCDGGHAVVDELDKIGKDADLRKLHSPLEDQIAPYNKAGLVGYFHTRCSCLAGANPKKTRFDVYSPFLEQIPLEGSLLSRFDLIFPMRDIPEEQRDNIIADAVLGVHLGHTIEDPEISPRDLRRIIAYARETYHPELTREAAAHLKKYYLRLREMGRDEGQVAVVPRNLNGFVRLAEAAARARFSNEVAMEDVDLAINLSSTALQRLLGSDVFDIDSVRTGLTRSTRDRLEDLVNFLRGEGKTLTEIEAFYQSHGWGSELAVRDLEHYRKRGEVYTIRDKYVLTGGS